jgi:hypothetical protein
VIKTAEIEVSTVEVVSTKPRIHEVSVRLVTVTHLLQES